MLKFSQKNSLGPLWASFCFIKKDTISIIFGIFFNVGSYNYFMGIMSNAVLYWEVAGVSSNAMLLLTETSKSIKPCKRKHYP